MSKRTIYYRYIYPTSNSPIIYKLIPNEYGDKYRMYYFYNDEWVYSMYQAKDEIDIQIYNNVIEFIDDSEVMLELL